ncbi:DNA polymerase epsilon catalytic subunit, partial [Aphelenchoides avenae]
PASKGEYQRIEQQLEQEHFGKPPKPYHSHNREEREKILKKRVQDYCKKVYSKTHVTREEKRETTICQRENPFYVNTVLAFRDRRYEYKAMLKKSKNALAAAASDDLNAIKSGKARVILYESLQLAHKCILNSFYGYVMRKGSRWFSMEMAGIVCHTGANIITEARKLVELIGRPLELDTDGIWCLLPSSFPEDFNFKTKAGKSGAMLNALVKDKFTNDQYHVLDPETGTYSVKSENSIFFEVDGPYLAMILPASKEEGKKLKKRYAVFNFDKTLAEIKGFEVKRRGELGIIKDFQTIVFSSRDSAYLKGSTLEEAYREVAKACDAQLNILLSKGIDLPDNELFDLIGENRSMSRKLEDYGEQKSTSITTAKRLAEFLGDEMVKNAGLACKFIVSRKPLDAPVTERTIPIAIFSAEPEVAVHYLRKWTKDSSITRDNFSVRELIDWQYYIERFGSCVQKIVTIPAALQGVSNPVPRIPYPDWLENKRRERVQMALQPRITEMFKSTRAPKTPKTPKTPGTPGWTQRTDPYITPRTANIRKRAPLRSIDLDCNAPEVIEIDDDTEGGPAKRSRTNVDDDADALEELPPLPTSTQTEPASTSQYLTLKAPLMGKKFGGSKKRKGAAAAFNPNEPMEKKTWRQDGFQEWLAYMKKKWKLQKYERRQSRNVDTTGRSVTNVGRMLGTGRSRLAADHWHIIQIVESNVPGSFTIYALDGGSLRRIELVVPRTFYVDDVVPRTNAKAVQKILPKMRPAAHLYEYSVDEEMFASKYHEFNAEMCALRINGIYESQLPLLFKAFVQVGSTCRVGTMRSSTRVQLEQLDRVSHQQSLYADLSAMRLMFFYEVSHTASNRSIFALFSPSTGDGRIFIVNRVRMDLANLDNLYRTERQKFIDKRGDDILDADCAKIKVEAIQATTLKQAVKGLQSFLGGMKLPPSDPTLICIQSNKSDAALREDFQVLFNYPHVRVRRSEPVDVMNRLEWANVVARRAIQHFFNSFIFLKDDWLKAQYMGIPVGNLPDDYASLALDMFYARSLQQNNCVLWASPSSRPDFGGKELDDLRLGNDWESASFAKNRGQVYNREAFEMQNVVVDVELGAVAVTALLQRTRIEEAEGMSGAVGFTSATPSLTIEGVLAQRTTMTDFDEAASVDSALWILKQVFHDLLREIYATGNTFADTLVMSMQRWMRDPGSLLYNPAICTAISTLMRKLCLMLVSEVNRLGGTVFHCSFSRMVFSTNRNGYDAASAFVESLKESLVHKPVFASIHIVNPQFSAVTLWIDAVNHASVRYSEDGEIQQKVLMKLTMAEALPEDGGCRQSLMNLIGGYMVLLSRKVAEKVPQDELIAFCNKGLLEEQLIDRIFNTTKKTVEVRDKLRLDADRIPPHLVDAQHYDAPLEFVKCICKVLSLNEAITDATERLRDQLMRILGNCDLSDTQWSPPTISVVLESIFCKECEQSCDLDVTTIAPDIVNGKLEGQD